MEKRWSKRSKVVAKIRFLSAAGELVPAKLRNLGIEGGFVEIDSALAAEEHEATIELKLETDSGPETFMLTSRVVHLAPDGVGIMFRDLKPRVVRALMRAVESPSDHIAA